MGNRRRCVVGGKVPYLSRPDAFVHHVAFAYQRRRFRAKFQPVQLVPGLVRTVVQVVLLYEQGNYIRILEHEVQAVVYGEQVRGRGTQFVHRGERSHVDVFF